MGSEMKCQVIEITRGTTHDGPGMRTTVFMKGCPLNCQWCQNPEGIKPGQDIWWEERKCIHCLSCIAACEQAGLTEVDNRIDRDREKCTLCGECVEACPAQAMTFTGSEWDMEQLLREVLKDLDYYRAFGGGVTVSGGEPLSQARFVAEFFRRLKESSVHTALDTCGLAPREALDAVLPFADAVLFDIKIIDPAEHKKYTGQSNATILQNLLYIASYMRNANTASSGSMRLWIRTPLIPDTTATPENIAAISAFIRDNLADVIERWELCAFNSICRAKYDKMDLVWAYEGIPLMDQSQIDEIKSTALSTGIAVDKLVISGLVAKGVGQGRELQGGSSKAPIKNGRE